MDLVELIKGRLEELGCEQGDLAQAVKVTPSFISQLMNRKKLPPSPDRTEIYRRMEKFLKLPSGEISKLADQERKRELKRKFDDPTRPLHPEIRELLLEKCSPAIGGRLQEIFGKDSFGQIEQLVVRTILQVAQAALTKKLLNENGDSDPAAKARRREFLDLNVFSLSAEHSLPFLDDLVKSWEIDLVTLTITVTLTRSVGGRAKRFAFLEVPLEDEPGFTEFLKDRRLSADVNEAEVKFLRSLKSWGKSPNKLYYYRELQNLRDPVHFEPSKTSRSMVSGREEAGP